MIRNAPPDIVSLRVAGLRLWLDARGSGLHLTVPESHAKFLQRETSDDGPTRDGHESPEVSCDLVLRVRNQQMSEISPEWTPLCVTKAWELWLDEAGRYVFIARRQSPPRMAIVDPGFTAGEVIGDFASGSGEDAFPLQGLGIMFFVNWLAGCGDAILHAAGVVVDGKGYCFTGSSGAGKSTLAAALASNPAATVLGEDQVILRYIDGHFTIYGTPWHLNPDLCSPLGAPLEKLFFLDREAPHPLAAIAPFDGVTRLLQTAFIPYYRPKAVSAILDRLAILAEAVPFYTLGYRLGDDPLALIQGA